MRGTRWLLLAAILVILGGTGVIYYIQQKTNLASKAATPPALPQNTNATANDWEWSRSDNGRAVVKMRAKSFRQVEDTGHSELEGLELNLFQRDGTHFDLVKSPKAEFNQTEEKLYSKSEVEITLSVPLQGPPPHPLTSVKTSGIAFESKTGKATTEQSASFRFENGDGTCTGASYDPNTKELHLLNHVSLSLHGKDPKSKVMHVEAGELLYKEGESAIWLRPNAHMVREETTIDAGPTLLHIKEGKVESIDAHMAHGVDKYPKRQLDYSADMVHVAYNDDGEITKISGMGNARMTATSDSSITNMTADSVDLDFTTSDTGESILTHTVGNGHSVIESKPVPDPTGKTKPSETHILRAAYIDLFMRDGGKEIDRVLTQTPGELEFLPNQPEQHRRLLHGDRMTIAYGPKNQIRSFETSAVTTETFPSDAERARAAKSQKQPAASKTSSVHLTADFDGNGQMKHMKQWENFIYEEGERHAFASTAMLDNDKNIMDLDTGARIWDAGGSTSGDHIQLDQKSGNYVASGHVNTSHVPDKDDPKKNSNSSGLLDGDEPIQGMADRMTSANHNRLVHYEGSAVLWQGSDRVQADSIDIDREKKTLKADGKVVSQLLDKPKGDDAKKRNTAQVFTLVKAPSLVYTDDDRLAHYTGGAVMDRPDLTVKGKEIHAYLSSDKDKQKDAAKKDPNKPDPNKKDNNDSRLEKAVTDGDVEIVDITPIRKRTGTGFHAEYYTADSRVVLRGSEALLVDTKEGRSQGGQLTYFTNDDRVIIDSTPSKQVKTHLQRKK